MEQMDFIEIQTFRQPILWAGLCVLFFVTVGIQLWIIASGGWQAQTLQWVGLGMSIVLIGGVSVLMYISRAETKVCADGLHTRFYPLESEKIIPWQEIANARSATIRPIRDCGGWGLRFGPKGKAYIVSGAAAVIVSLKSGKYITLGTQQQSVLEEAIRHRLQASPGGL